ncbi:MAG: hypothetical protein WCY71_09450 [Halothiobacillaceae bacterium]
MKRFAAGLTAAALLATASVAGLASLVAQADHNQVYELHQRGEIVSLVELIREAQAIQPGQMIEAKLDVDALIYELIIYGEDDRYYEMYFDARDGRLLTTHADDESDDDPDDDGHPLDELPD